MRWWRPVPVRTAAAPGRDGGTAGARLARAAPPARTRSWHPLEGWAEIFRAPFWRDRRAGFAALPLEAPVAGANQNSPGLSNAASPRSARLRGERRRSAGDLETGLFNLDDQVAGKAGVDAQCALDPLPRFGYDILVEPLA